MILEILVLLSPIFLYVVYVYLGWNYKYWKKRGIPSLEGSVPFGNVKDIFLTRKTMGQVYSKIYRDFPNEPMVGLYKMRDPILLVRHPELVKAVLLRDFQCFEENDFHFDFNVDPIFSYNPFSLSGKRWKSSRTTLIQAMTPPKLKNMVPLFREKCLELLNYLDKNQMIPLEGKTVGGNLTADVVASCAFGKECNSFDNPNNKFRLMSNRVLSGDFLPNLAVLFTFYAPAIGKLLKIRMVPKEVVDCFVSEVSAIANKRLKEGVRRNDILQTLLDENTEAEARGDPPGQCMNFYLDGFNTSAIAIGFCLYELARNPECQEKAREEIMQYESDISQMDYSTLQNLNYLEGIILETMRLHPPVPQMTRMCTKDTVLAHDGKEVEIKTGMAVVIPSHALQMDPQYYPQPEVFKPERFTEEEKSKRHRFVYLAFGEGPRICLGMKFALMQIKMCLATIILNFEILPKDPTSSFEIDTGSSFMYLAKGGVWVKFRRLEK